MARPKKEPGIRPHGAGWQTYVMVGGTPYTKQWPAETPAAEMRAWRERQKARHVPTRRGTLADDVARYLSTVRHMPTFTEREKHLRDWITALGPQRSRTGITTHELSEILSRWLTEPRSTDDPRPLAPVSVRHRRTALLRLYRVLDGKGVPNPVADTPRPADPPPQPRAVPLAYIRRVLAALRPSATRARLMVLLATGLPHASLMLLTPADVDVERRIVRVPARRKGKGAAARVLPLSDAGLAAFRELAAWEAWGPFSQSAMGSAVHRVCDRLGLPRFRVYDLRHTAGTLLYQQTGDLATTARLLGHSTARITERYTQEAHLAVDTAAVVAFGRALAGVLEPEE